MDDHRAAQIQVDKLTALSNDPDRMERLQVASGELTKYLGRLMQPNPSQGWEGLTPADLARAVSTALHTTLQSKPISRSVALALSQEFKERANRPT